MDHVQRTHQWGGPKGRVRSGHHVQTFRLFSLGNGGMTLRPLYDQAPPRAAFSISSCCLLEATLNVSVNMVVDIFSVIVVLTYIKVL